MTRFNPDLIDCQTTPECSEAAALAAAALNKSSNDRVKWHHNRKTLLFYMFFINITHVRTTVKKYSYKINIIGRLPINISSTYANAGFTKVNQTGSIAYYI